MKCVDSMVMMRADCRLSHLHQLVIINVHHISKNVRKFTPTSEFFPSQEIEQIHCNDTKHQK